ncbi:MAG: metallophosphoesterase [Bacteroidetes bacterium]|nr:MAG: metallophosphoesterase [Bacteroidota bacterium]
MKIQYCSDLHLEFPENKDFLELNPLRPNGDILVLAGDIVPFVIMEKYNDFFGYVSDNFEQTYWIPGNHEYYHSDIIERSGVLNEKIRGNVTLVNNVSIMCNNTKLIFSTLWSKIRPAYQWQIERGMSDFHVIKNNGFRFSADKFNQLHEESLAFIKKELNAEMPGKKVVATHHVPTFFNYPEKYKGDVLNDAFAVELSGLIEANGPEYWVYGHTHHNSDDFKIGKTELLTNQLGYVRHGEHASFEGGKYFNVI